jgi:CRP/FNR family cyclic AMP-dependent transcriptional regulator
VPAIRPQGRKVMASQDEIVDALAGMALFADLSTPQLKGVAHIFEEGWFPSGERILRQGLTGSAFYVIVEGEAQILVDGQQRATLGKGEFFGDVSILLGEAPVADVVAKSALRVLTLPGPQVEAFLKAHPTVMYRMLQALARRLRNANRWRN